MPVKTEWWGAGIVFCLGRGADLHMAKLISLPLTVLFQEIQIGFGFTFLVLAHPGSPGQNPESLKMVVVVVVALAVVFTLTFAVLLI